MNLTTDNASSNDVLVEEAARLLLSIYGVPYHPENRVRCINHVFNLVSQSILAGIGEAEDPEDEDEDDFLHTKDAPLDYSADKDPDQSELEKAREDDLKASESAMDDLFAELERTEAGKTSQSALQRVRYFVLFTVRSKLTCKPYIYSSASCARRYARHLNVDNFSTRSRRSCTPRIRRPHTLYC